jgi:hypothetical protein
MATTPTAPTTGTDINALIDQKLAALGGTATGVASNVSNVTTALYGSDATNIPVQTGRKKVGIGNVPGVYVPGGATPEQAQKIIDEAKRRSEQLAPEKKPISDVYGEFYNMDATQRQGLQTALFAAGFYGTKKLDSIPFGEADDTSEAALTALLVRTAKMNAAGQDVTWEEVLANLSGSDAAKARLAAGGGGGSSVSYYDPTYLAQTLDDAAKNVLGRKASVDEQRMFINAFHAAQAANTNIQSPPASAEAFARQNAPVEAGAHDVSNTFGEFVKLLGGIGAKA